MSRWHARYAIDDDRPVRHIVLDRCPIVLPSFMHAGHEERMAAHARRIEADMRKLGIPTDAYARIEQRAARRDTVRRILASMPDDWHTAREIAGHCLLGVHQVEYALQQMLRDGEVHVRRCGRLGNNWKLLVTDTKHERRRNAEITIGDGTPDMLPVAATVDAGKPLPAACTGTVNSTHHQSRRTCT